MATPGILHLYCSRLVAFEFEQSAQHENVIFFIGGLGDGLLTVPYLSSLAAALDKIRYSTVQILISSSYIGWGTGTLSRDATEIDEAIAYFRKLRKGKFVLMGHSTGCQDTMYYLTRHHSLNKLDGAILQAPVSDREAMQQMFPDRYEMLLNYALDQALQGKGDNVLPKEYSDHFFGTPVSANRWLSLAQKNGDDDFFSSDLSDQDLKSTFGVVGIPLCVLISGCDEFMPTDLDKKALFDRWLSFASSPLYGPPSGVVEEARHNVGQGSGSNSESDLITYVSDFILRRVN
ncbi:hypothetical protein V1512DRAFT_263326 [Lipomyces arxii]|uniref:uncharacterized protein n=1 Tax=Lipomyces arxii TaxID=56418 RepID=UPI0034D0079E